MAIICLFLITGLATAMLTSARTERLIATNEERAVLARMAAEAGLNHGIQVVAEHLSSFQYANIPAAASDLFDGPDDIAGNTDDGILSEYGLNAVSTTTTLSASDRTTYDVRAYDDDNATARSITQSTDDLGRIGEQDPANVTTDLNRRVTVQSTGYGPAGTTTRLEVTLGAVLLPAIVTGGNLTITGNVDVGGTLGGVHSNGDFVINGNAFSAEQNCTASGTSNDNFGNCSATGINDDGRPSVTLPNVQASDYLDEARYRLNADGTVLSRATPGAALVACTGACLTPLGWTFSGGTWTPGGSPDYGGYYVEGDITVSSNISNISIFSTGSLTSNNNMSPIDPNNGNAAIAQWATTAFLVLNGDFLSGPSNLGLAANDAIGIILVREQIRMHGNHNVYGQLIAQNASNLSSTVTSNDFNGNINIQYSATAGLSSFNVLSWREIR